MCRSPKLFAACHVLRRLLMPRHSPCALFRLTFVGASSVSFAPAFPPELIHSAAPPLPRKLAFARMETGVSGSRLRHWFSELCRLIQDFFYEIVLPFLSSTIASEFSFCCLACLFLCSVFNVQIVDASSAPSVSATGLAASRENFRSLRCISSSSRTVVRSDSDDGREGLPPGGLKWTRTTDLTIISRVL